MSDREGLLLAAEAIGAADRLALACHVGPDGDALGSMLALGIAAVGAGKEVVASFGSPHSVPSSLSFLPVDLLKPPAAFPESPGVMIVFDAGSAERLGELAEAASAAQTLVVLDHHLTNEGFGDISIVDPAASATGVLVFDLLGILAWEITPPVANCLLTALVTDTGRFTYANTTPETLRIAAELVTAGAEPTEIGRHVYEEAPFGYLAAAAAAMERAVLDTGRGVVSTSITHADLKAAGVDWVDVDALIDTIRLAQEADVAILAKVHADGRVKVSLRSRGATDVGSLAAAMGGGGHRLAAGFTVGDEPEVVVQRVIEMVEDFR